MDATTGTAEIPEGFRQIEIPDYFVGLIGPLYYKGEADGLRMGLVLEKRHCNPLHIAHGGMMVTLADMVLGLSCSYGSGGDHVPHPTVSLNSEFIAGGKLGTWIEGKGIVLRRGKSVVFANTTIVDQYGNPLMHASGVFRVPGKTAREVFKANIGPGPGIKF